MGVRQMLVAGNWKMNGSRTSVEQLVGDILDQISGSESELVIFPPFVFLSMVAEMIQSKSVSVGAQNINSHPKGAFTGEVSAAMVAEFGCKYVLIGHSERRSLFDETDDIVSEKFTACVKSGLIPVLCVGETAAQKQEGRSEEIVHQQLQIVLDRCGIGAFTDALIAYEPVWAIGTGQSADPGQAAKVHELIRNVIAEEDQDIGEKIRLLYGGSVTPENAASLFAEEHIDGALVGGASLNATDFMTIFQLAGN